MGFEYTVTGQYNDGEYQVKYGTFTNGAGDSGGDIITQLNVVVDFELQQSGAAVVDDEPVINETLPLESGTVTIVTTLNADGYWRAKGY